MRRQNAAVLAAAGMSRGIEHDRAGTVAEQHAGRAVAPIDDARERLGSDHQRALEGSALEQAVRDRKAKTKPEHTACMSNAAPWVMPRPAWTATAVAGKVWSGVEVASTMRSIDCASTCPAASAARAAASARSDVISPGAAMRRSRMPVRWPIQASEVSTLWARSALVRTWLGR